jgi:hypothetical protein
MSVQAVANVGGGEPTDDALSLQFWSRSGAPNDDNAEPRTALQLLTERAQEIASAHATTAMAQKRRYVWKDQSKRESSEQRKEAKVVKTTGGYEKLAAHVRNLRECKHDCLELLDQADMFAKQVEYHEMSPPARLDWLTLLLRCGDGALTTMSPHKTPLCCMCFCAYHGVKTTSFYRLKTFVDGGGISNVHGNKGMVRPSSENTYSKVHLLLLNFVVVHLLCFFNLPCHSGMIGHNTFGFNFRVRCSPFLCFFNLPFHSGMIWHIVLCFMFCLSIQFRVRCSHFLCFLNLPYHFGMNRAHHFFF